MNYSQIPNFSKVAERISLYAQLGVEIQLPELQSIVDRMLQAQGGVLESLQRVATANMSSITEPNDLVAIRSMRPAGPRKIWNKFNENEYADRLSGALLARFAGCTLGTVVELAAVGCMENLAKETGMDFPPTDYWVRVSNPYNERCFQFKREDYTRTKLKCVPMDDDISYTLLGLLIAEEYGLDFSTADVGNAWVKYLPMACTAEEVALNNLKNGVSADKAAEMDNPYYQWIGADIRSDPWGYIAPGYPELAAEMAWRDAYLSHRRNGIYGEMFFAAVISAAFTVDSPMEAVKIGLSEIPADCELAKALRWCLAEAVNVHDYKSARAAVDERFAGMSHVHTINNACLTVFGLSIGGTDMTKVISQTVAMGMDNDCTTATAGSIVGAVIGQSRVPEHWYKPFNDTVATYLKGQPEFKITNVVQRFTDLAMKIHERF